MKPLFKTLLKNTAIECGGKVIFLHRFQAFLHSAACMKFINHILLRCRKKSPLHFASGMLLNWKKYPMITNMCRWLYLRTHFRSIYCSVQATNISGNACLINKVTNQYLSKPFGRVHLNFVLMSWPLLKRRSYIFYFISFPKQDTTDSFEFVLPPSALLTFGYSLLRQGFEAYLVPPTLEMFCH